MKINALSILFFMSIFFAQAQVKLSTDFTSESDKKSPIHDVWNVANRISPTNGSNIRPGLKMNIVRMIGGIRKVVNGNSYKDLDFDPCLYDSINNVYVYRWEPLIERLDKVVNSQTEILQIALDQPPWAFQHGYTFIPEGTRDNINFRENEKMSIYGNSLPPANKQAYHDFIIALMTKLVETYGEEKVLSWRFRVGSEIETPEHWYGTKQDFIEHFVNTESAVRSVLPNAKVGVHTRNPGFLYKNGTELNYKGEPYASFIEGLIDYNFDNNIKCDFWGLSDYIVIGNSGLRDLNGKYNKNFVPLINNPKWNPETSIDIMEYKTVTTMNGADDKGTIGCQTTHRDIVELIFSNTYYKNKNKGLEYIYRWGNSAGDEDPDGIKELSTMLGMVRYETTITGSPNTSTNELDAIFAKNEVDGYDVLIYNYNSNSLNYVNSEAVDVSFVTDLPVGTDIYYRSKSYGKENNKLQNFLINNSNYVKSGFDEKGDPERTLTPEGFTAYQNYQNPNPHVFSAWKSVTTNERTDGGSGSVVSLSTEIGSFAFEKFEFRTEASFVKAITPANFIWATTEDFSAWTAVNGGMTINTDNDKLSVAFSTDASWPMVAITGLNINSSLFGTLRVVVKNSTEKPDLQMAPNAPGTTFVTGRKKETIPNDNQWHTLDFDLINWGLWTGTITEFKFYNNVSSGSIVFDRIEFMPRVNIETHTITISKEGQGLLNYSSGTAFAGQEFILNAIANEGWEFSRWEGDVSSTDNPLAITVTSDMNIKAVFSNSGLSVTEHSLDKLTVFPNPSSSGVFNIKTQTPQNWEVYALDGRKILSGHGSKVNISSFSKGIYILRTGSSFAKLLY